MSKDVRSFSFSTCTHCSKMKMIGKKLCPVMPEPGVPGVPLAPPPIFGRSVNPIPTEVGQIMPTITTGPPKVFHLPASLLSTLVPKFSMKVKVSTT